MNTVNPTVEGIDQAPAAADAVVSAMFAEEDNMEQHLKVMLDARARADELEALLTDAKRSQAIAEQAVVAKMLEQGLDSFKALGKSISRSEVIRASVNKEHRAEQIDWLQEIGAGHLVEQTVNAQSFAALVRNDFIKAGKPFPEAGISPEGFINVFREQRLMVRSV